MFALDIYKKPVELDSNPISTSLQEKMAVIRIILDANNANPLGPREGLPRSYENNDYVFIVSEEK